MEKMNARGVVITLLIAGILTTSMLGPVMADYTNKTVPTKAVVDPSNPLNAPIVLAKWELPDDDWSAPGTQVMPVPNANKSVEFYMVATDPNGAADIANAGFRIAHPLVPDPKPCWMPESVDPIWGYGVVQNLKMSFGTTVEWRWDTDEAKIREAIARAVRAGLLTTAEANELIERLRQYEARFFAAQKDFTCCYAPGMYEVTAWVSDSAGGQGELKNNLEYLSLIAIELDFTKIDYGNIVPGVPQIVSGDTDMTTPAKPTVKSLGNDPIQIWVRASEMVGVYKGDKIVDFDARLDHNAVAVFKAGIDTMVPGCLIPNYVEKMDFSVRPPFGTPADTYEGTMNLWITHYEC